MNKKITIFTLVLSSLLIFSACNFSSNSGTKNIEKDGKHFVISGDILTGGQRSASTSFTLTSSHIIEITATHNADGVAADSTKATATVTGNKYSIVLDAPGEWNMLLTISVKNEKTNENDILYSVNGTINITNEGKILDPNGNQLDSSNINFTIRPDFGLSCPGSINLKIKDESGKIKKVSYSAELNGTSNTNSLSSVSEVTFENNEATISRNEVYPNSYKVKFNFDDDAGNTLYSCYEIVTVTAGFATDTWIGNGAHIRKNTETGTTEFVITNTLIEKFGTDVMPDTDYILYNYNSSETQYNVTDSLDSIDGQSINVEGNKSNQYAFDKNGNIYFLITSDSGKTIKKGNENYTYTSAVTTDRILIDRKNNVLYGCQINGMTLDLYRFDYFISGPDEKRNEYTTLSGYRFPSDVFGEWYYHDSEVLTIYDGILYGANSRDKLFYKLDLNKAESVADKIDLSLKDYIDNSYLSNCDFSDIIYQDGYIYILIRNVREDSSSGLDFYSRGGVICFNTFTNSVEKFIGWTDSPLSNDDVYTYLTYRGLVKDADDNYVLAKTSDIVDKDDEKTMYNIYCPEYEDEGFYGPEKFIAIKPKKLVIADNGLAYYTDDNDAYRVKNLNRVVTVDLETFALEVSEVDSSIKFASETTNGSGYLAGNACMYASIPSDTPLYKSSDKSQMTTDEINSIVNGKRNTDYQDKGMFPDMDIGGGVPAIPFDTTNL